jgi:hypothetical protein
MTIIASLPPALLWAASFAASSDPSKGPICAIEARREGTNIRFTGVDGHRCFRALAPAGHYFCPEEPLRLSPKAFSKNPTLKALTVEIDDGGVASFKDRFGNTISTVVWQADPWALSEQPFPNIEQIWPEPSSLVCNPGEFVAMNASYLGDFMKVAAKLAPAPGVVRMHTADSANTPMVWEALLDNGWLEKADDGTKVWLQYLLSPLMVRRD